jgi:hypothetical protein
VPRTADGCRKCWAYCVRTGSARTSAAIPIDHGPLIPPIAWIAKKAPMMPAVRRGGYVAITAAWSSGNTATTSPCATTPHTARSGDPRAGRLSSSTPATMTGQGRRVSSHGMHHGVVVNESTMMAARHPYSATTSARIGTTAILASVLPLMMSALGIPRLTSACRD